MFRHVQPPILGVGQVGGVAQMQPVIFILGPSGVGKSYVSEALKEDCAFLHLDLDKKHGFERNGFPEEWDRDSSKLDYAQLATQVRTRVAEKKRSGAVSSFPTVNVFSIQQIEGASREGIYTIVLCGSEERCLEIRRERQRRRIGRFNEGDEKRYRRLNRAAFETYARSEYANFGIEVFQPDGSRWPLEHLLRLILARASD